MTSDIPVVMRHKLLAVPFKVSFWAYHLTSAVGGNIAAAVGLRGWWVGFLGPKGSQVVEEMLTRNSRFISFWRYSELPWKRNFFLFKMNFKSQWISMNVLPQKCPERSLPKILPTLVPTFFCKRAPALRSSRHALSAACFTCEPVGPWHWLLPSLSALWPPQHP